MHQKKSRWFRARRHRHDPILVLNMSIFNSGSTWNRIFNQVPPARERLVLNNDFGLSSEFRS